MKKRVVKVNFVCIVFLITIQFFNQVVAQKSVQSDAPLYSWIKNIYTNPEVVQSGSLLSDPFQKKNNTLPDIIFLSRLKIFSGNTSHKINKVFSTADSLVRMNDFSDALKRLEKEKMISFDSSIFSDKKVHVLGILYLNGVYKNRNGSVIYVDHSYAPVKGTSIFSAIVKLHFKNKKWNMGKTIVYDMSN